MRRITLESKERRVPDHLGPAFWRQSEVGLPLRVTALACMSSLPPSVLCRVHNRTSRPRSLGEHNIEKPRSPKWRACDRCWTPSLKASLDRVERGKKGKGTSLLDTESHTLERKVVLVLGGTRLVCHYDVFDRDTLWQCGLRSIWILNLPGIRGCILSLESAIAQGVPD